MITLFIMGFFLFWMYLIILMDDYEEFFKGFWQGIFYCIPIMVLWLGVIFIINELL